MDKIIKLAKNKTTSQMCSKRIASIINSALSKRKELDNIGNQLSIHCNTVNNYLKEFYGKPRKIRRAFFCPKNKCKKG